MTDQELRKLNRRDLLELLVSQSRERDYMQAELARMKKDLQDRRIQVEQAGSIAQAALQLNGVFEAAQAAAEQYLQNIEQRSREIEDICARREAVCIQREKATQKKIEHQLRAAAEHIEVMEEESRRKCEKMEREAKQKAQAYWSEVSGRLKHFYEDYRELKEILAFGGQKRGKIREAKGSPLRKLRHWLSWRRSSDGKCTGNATTGFCAARSML